MNAEPTAESASLTAGDYRLQVQLAPLSCALFERGQAEPVWQMGAVRLRPAAGDWQRVGRAELTAVETDRLAVELSAEDGTPVELCIVLADHRLDVELRAEAAGEGWLAADLLARPDEHYLGLGERFDALDQRGRQVDLWVEDGAHGGLTYLPVPFFTSSRGYGLHVDSDLRCLLRLATPDDPGVVSIRHAAPWLKLTVLPGRSPKEILSRYTAIAGRPELPPAWVFGPWKSRDWQTADQAGIEEDVVHGHALGLPATVKLIDARWEQAYHTFAFDRRKFLDPAGMIDRVHAHGCRLAVWLSPWMAVDNGDDSNDAFYACAERGFLIRNPAGEVYVHRLGTNPMLIGSCIDLTNPEAAAWWQAQIRRLVELGVDGINTDFGEQVPEDALFWDGRTGRELHNLYPRLYNELTYRALQEALGPADRPGALLARSGWHGSQRLSAVWAGDQTSDFSPGSGLPSAVLAGLSAGLSGLAFWGSDIGGYFGTPSDEVYIRWTQFAAFCPIMMVHGAGRREPWTFSEQALSVYRRYAQLHTDLFPYLYAYARQAAETGLPLMRAMPLEFPDDPQAWSELAELQYCLGAELLVAPVTYGFARTRLVYLPAGGWRDYWTGEPLEGGRVIARPTDPECIPVFARAGAIVPYLDPSPDTLLPATAPGVRPAGDDLRVDVYLGADGRFWLADGTRLTWDEAGQTLTVSDSPVARRVRLRRVGVDGDYRPVPVGQS